MSLLPPQLCHGSRRHAPSRGERPFRHQYGRALSAKASADGARPAAGEPGIKVTTTSRLGLGREPSQKRGLGHGELGGGALGRAQGREKGQAASSNTESSPATPTGSRQPHSRFPVEPEAPGVTQLPPFGTSALAVMSCSPQTSSAVTADPSNPGAGAAQPGRLPSLPPDLQLQLQDLCSSCSLPEGTRLLVGVTSSHTPFLPRGTSENNQDFKKKKTKQNHPTKPSHAGHPLPCS